MAPISAIPARSGPALSEAAGRWGGEAMTRIARLKAFDWEASQQLLATWRRRLQALGRNPLAWANVSLKRRPGTHWT